MTENDRAAAFIEWARIEFRRRNGEQLSEDERTRQAECASSLLGLNR
jgi:hypothetical protein